MAFWATRWDIPFQGNFTMNDSHAWVLMPNMSTSTWRTFLSFPLFSEVKPRCAALT